VIYRTLRALAGVALRWYYRDIRVCGLEHVPRDGALLVAPNHPNALVDALLVGSLLPRRLLITAKATIFANPVASWGLGRLGVVPLRRASDERARVAAGGVPDRTRNEDSFRAVLDALRAGGAVLMFPEGKSWDQPHLAPLRTGAARIALQARDMAQIRGLSILPVGLVFEQKEAPRSRVLVEIGEPIRLDAWTHVAGANPVAALTEDLRAHLHAVTLNYPSIDAAVREGDLAALFAAIRDEGSTVAEDRSLATEVMVARRIAAVRDVLTPGIADAETSARVDALLRRVDAFHGALAEAGVGVDDVSISPRTLAGARFALREGGLLVAGAPVAFWGRLHHWLPFRLARGLARGGTSRADPAMRTIVSGLVLTLVWYVAIGTAVLRLSGSLVASIAYVLSLPIAEDFALRYQERLGRARRRMHAYFRFRRDPALQHRLQEEAAWLREESFALERALLREERASAS
jgi:glycerol-3-phosphate O-acyltransferase / dihydroxyacetone phosphate acyltransferase